VSCDHGRRRAELELPTVPLLRAHAASTACPRRPASPTLWQAMTTRTTRPQGPAPRGLERFLQDPWGRLGELADRLVSQAPGWGLRLLAVAVPLVAGVLVVRLGWRRWRHQRLVRAARLVQILPPPQVEPAAAEPLWANLAGLLRQRHPLDPRPHVSFELTWTTTGVTIGLWVPGTVAPRLVERAVEACWPGARTSTHPDHPTHPPMGWCWPVGSCGWPAGPGSRSAPSTGLIRCGPCWARPVNSPMARPPWCRCWPARPAPGDSPAPTGPPTLWPAARARGPAWWVGCWTCSPQAAPAAAGRRGRPTPRPPSSSGRRWRSSPGRAGRSGSATGSAAPPASPGGCGPAATPWPRHPEQADRWTWLVLTAYTQLRLARQLACDQRLPWERPRPLLRLSPVRVRRGFPQLLCALGSPATDTVGESSVTGWRLAMGMGVGHGAVGRWTIRAIGCAA
jgi:hypothetical protein